jgi:hypothetical protein
MGLDTTHDAFHGAYTAFNRFRQAICKAMGGSFPPHETEFFTDGERIRPDLWHWGPGYNAQSHPGLNELLLHSDCDGLLSPKVCRLLADELESLLPQISALGDGGGHIADQGGYGGVCRKFINGCRLAAENNEPLEFS